MTKKSFATKGMKRATTADYEEYLRQCKRYWNDEDDGTIMDDDEDDCDENEGRTEYVLEQPDGSQIYWDYQKAVEGFNLYCDHYEHEGWTRVCRRQARNAAVVDGVEVRAMCAVYAYGDLHKRIDLRVRIECD